jgi:hypothetical protein
LDIDTTSYDRNFFQSTDSPLALVRQEISDLRLLTSDLQLGSSRREPVDDFGIMKPGLAERFD